MGRSAPEIGVFEATVQGDQDKVSQRAPFNTGYEWSSTTENFIVSDLTITELILGVSFLFSKCLTRDVGLNDLSSTQCFLANYPCSFHNQ